MTRSKLVSFRQKSCMGGGRHPFGESPQARAMVAGREATATLTQVARRATRTGAATPQCAASAVILVAICAASWSGSREARAQSWAPVPSLLQARQDHVALLVSSGEVVVIGGQTALAPLDSVEIYSPSARSWRSGSPRRVRWSERPAWSFSPAKSWSLAAVKVQDGLRPRAHALRFTTWPSTAGRPSHRSPSRARTTR